VGVRRYQDLIAWQLADAFKREVFRLVQGDPGIDFRYRSQLIDATSSVASNIVEGFLRCSRGDFARYLAISLGSLGEAETRLRDGILLGYFSETDCEAAFRFGRRCAGATLRLKLSQAATIRTRAKKLKEADK
jgi:four helix bundle protein